MKARRGEMEHAIFARVCAISDSAGIDDDAYAQELRRAVSAGIGHALTGLEHGDERAGPVPGALFAHARQAARSGVTPDVALRQYFAGYTLFSDFVLRAAEANGPLRRPLLEAVMHTQAILFERIVAAAMGEYGRERGQHRLPEQRQLDRIKKLLAGDSADPDELAYEFDDWHIGAIGRGAGAAPALRQLTRFADRRLLLVRSGRDTVWAWFAGRQRMDVSEVAANLPPNGVDDALVAFGEPARGQDGWRLTHQQASAALQVAREEDAGVVRYADVGLLASIARDRLLTSSLQELYLAPLADDRDGGSRLRETLRAYFSSGRNVSSAASALGVSRQTVRSRLLAIEGKLGRTLESCAPEVEVALRLEASGDLTLLDS